MNRSGFHDDVRPADSSGVAQRPSWQSALLTMAVLILVPSAVMVRHASSPLPLAQDWVSSDAGWVDESRCAECHEQALTFWETGHAQTLRPANDPASISVLATLIQQPACVAEGTSLKIDGEQITAVNDADGVRSQAELDWCFGSGRHAQTWVAGLTDSYGATDLLEYRWTWYHETEDFDITPGQPVEATPGYFGRLGVLFDHPKARRCFGCHASVVPVEDGEIQYEQIHAGVTCQRCHGPRAEHVATEGKVHDPFWSDISQEESVARCGVCHRVPQEFDPADIRADNPEMARFQPVGLLQSRCYQMSQMTCVTCHDPHQTLEAQDSLRISQCVQCHDGADTLRPLCSAGHATDCLSCHMPKVAMDRPLEFTDHWIRVPDDESAP